ncbi:pregnancy-associated plasma protein A, pappalysin 1a isoform X3 [Pristis pectinata]|uniref:pregnancy-associated plasma protein A, pappalysin 1a isoform X3 n=1 Tax=Pristis pectinata TaxID=685728 RepID=UPI00223D796E|nr:pregnancy-associated plasma protein A, pappalysin 1a isoform X3 [Pristis pectinata]
MKMQVWSLLSTLCVLALGMGSECDGRKTGQPQRSKRALLLALDHQAGAGTDSSGSCGTRLPRGKRAVPLPHSDHPLRQLPPSHPPPPPHAHSPGRLLYFAGIGNQLRLRTTTELPRRRFTLEVRVKAEGGQRSPAVIAGLYDKCSSTSRDRGWILGIQSVSDLGNRDPRFFFTLKTDRARKMTTIIAQQKYHANQWVHLAVSYDGRKMKLYVNGAQVAVSNEQVGDIFSPLSRKCKALTLGGNFQNQNYRGYIADFSLWSEGRTQQKIIQDMKHHTQNNNELVLHDNFEDVERHWLTVKDSKYPQTEPKHHLDWISSTNLEPPPCGQTVCDNIEVITSYNNLFNFRKLKTVRYRVVNVYDDNHQKPTVTREQIELQHQHLNNAFDRYNITWDLTVLDIKNSSLRNRLILANCDISKIGNGECDLECNHTLTGNDGGDCKPMRRSPLLKKKGDGVCDMDCNDELYNFDDGDCCNPEATDVTKTCFDPKSPYRAYLDVKDLKNILKLDGATHLNIFFANSSDEELAGVATWPWDKEALTHLGGIVLNPSFYGIPGHTHTMIHEIGHSLGLYHVFKGISEIESCTDPCMETEASMDTGDLCADTNPTPKNKQCKDPDPGNETCGFGHFINTPFFNYMSYADDDCTNSFSPNQVARMHCYLDLVYQSWQPTTKPPPVPVAPEIIHQSAESVTFHWLHPIDGQFYESELGSVCDACTERGELVQYAFNASSPRPCDPSGHWSPREAEGPPDVEQPCENSVRTWSPDAGVDDKTVPPVCPEPQGCYLELEFRYALIPDSLTIWVTFTEGAAHGAVHNIKLLTVNGNEISLGPQNVFCDVPITVRLLVTEEVYAVQIFTLDEHLEIDAAMLTSAPQNTLCRECQPIRYKITRDPPFQEGPTSIVKDLSRKFEDVDVKPNTLYTYQVVVAKGLEDSEPSPQLKHMHGAAYCGDGLIQRHLGEECDDKNKMNGDGCSSLCRQEPSFNCVDEPSRCYFHDGDGVCEDFEKKTSVQDCGLYTPNGFMDQWANNVTVSHHDDQYCPGWVIIGHPAATKVCKTRVIDLSDGVAQYAWFPCLEAFHSTPFYPAKYWLKAYFAQPMVAAAVIVHLATDGISLIDQKQESIAVQLVDTKDQNHDLGMHLLNCRNNPLVIPVIHDLSKPFYRTSAILITFHSMYIAISGVALRSFHNFDPITISSCQSSEMYNPTEQSCVHYSCEATDCQELNLQNAVLNCTGAGRYNGDQCIVSCKEGYVLHQRRDEETSKRQPKLEMTVICTDGKWNQQLQCEPVDCGIPDQYHVYPATFSCPEGTTFGKQCTFQCRPPAHLRGTNNTLTCLDDGLWSFPESLCELMCLAPPPVPNAVLQSLHCQQDGHKVGSSCKYKCRPGYHVPSISRKIRKRTFKTKCTEDGSWQPGVCVPVMCEAVPAKFHGFYHCTNGFQFNSVCWINCSDANNQTEPINNVIRCRKDGTWNGSLQVCSSMKGNCLQPHRLNSHIRLTCRQGYGIGAECTTSCLSHQNDPVILPSNMTSDDVKYWMNPPKAKSIVCTAGLKWHPHPEMIHCIKSCEQPFVGDSYCDGNNNRAYCSYDGGDCCASTVITKKVIPFPMSCELHGDCACRDPTAQEHGKVRQQRFYHGHH